MIQGFDITNPEWNLTPQSVRLAAVSLQHQLYIIKARFNYYEKQLSTNQTRIERLERINQIKILEIEQLQLENLKLKERLRQNSSNSSLPPSSDLPSQKQLEKVLGSGGKQGGQPGRRGVSRKLIPLDQINQVIELRRESCSRCGSLLLGVDAAPACRQVAEIKDGRALVTEYRRHRIKCLNCRQINRENWPVEASKGSFGSHAQAVVAYLTGRLSLSHRETFEALQSLFDLKIGLGSIAAIQRRISRALAESVE